MEGYTYAPPAIGVLVLLPHLFGGGDEPLCNLFGRRFVLYGVIVFVRGTVFSVRRNVVFGRSVVLSYLLLQFPFVFGRSGALPHRVYAV
jgi:hypothetical protein